jgi:hypothetical protein
MGRGMAPEPTLTRQRGGRKLPNNTASPRCPDGKRVASSRLEGAAQADFIKENNIAQSDLEPVWLVTGARPVLEWPRGIRSLG